MLAHPGELSSGALLEMGDVSSMIARAEVYQSDVPRIRPGDPAEVDILGTRVAGKVTRIGSIVGKNQLTSIDPRAMRDLRVVEVTIQLDRAEPARRVRGHGGRGRDPPLGQSASARGDRGPVAQPAPAGSTTGRRPERDGARDDVSPDRGCCGCRRPRSRCATSLHGGRRTVAAVAGVAFAVTMVLLQLGFYGAVKITATNIYEQLDFDVVLLAATYDQFFAPGEFPMERLRQARSLESVVGAAPLYSTFNLWRCPPYPPDDPAVAWDDERPEPGPLRRWLLGDRLPRPLKRRELLVIGVALENDPFLGPIRRAIDEAAPRLQEPRRVLLDELSNLDFGWPLVGRFDGWEMGRTAVRVVGGFPMLRGFAADGVAICSDVNFARLCERPSTEQVQFGFLKLRDDRPGDASRPPAARCARSCRRTSCRIPGPRSSGASRTTGSARRRPASCSPSACWSRRSWPPR